MKTMVIFIAFITTSIFFCYSFSQSIVKTLPGYSGNLPFKLETGYVSVDKGEEIELFYYFIESERNPEVDPLLLWLTGGPGCSGLNGLAFELGPIAFDGSFNGSLPSLILREHSWTKIANVIFIDSPVGTGFSYATRANNYNTSDTLSAKHIDTFLRKWLLNHPVFIGNDLYIGGDSYGGKMAPIVVHELLNGNEAGLEPQTSLQGYLIGNPTTDTEIDGNAKIPYAHGMALISTEYYELAKRSCHGHYVNPDPNNVQCLHALALINECFITLNTYNILEVMCAANRKKRGVEFLEDDHISSHQQKPLCSDDMNNMMSHVWANDPQVRNALHVRKGIIKEWKKCNTVTPAYKMNVTSTVPYHRLLTQKISKALVYSGDHDMVVPYIGTLKWIGLLNLTIDEAWRPWNVNDELAGYVQKYKKNEFCLTFATVKGAGHTVPTYMPEQALAMFDRWISSNPL
ncbi:hypothetical protein ACS0TY_022969 [Phlomoides rotata]